MAEYIRDEEIEAAKRKIKDFIGVGNQLTFSKDQLKNRGLSISLSPGLYPLYVVIDALVRETHISDCVEGVSRCDCSGEMAHVWNS